MVAVNGGGRGAHRYELRVDLIPTVRLASAAPSPAPSASGRTAAFMAGAYTITIDESARRFSPAVSRLIRQPLLTGYGGALIQKGTAEGRRVLERLHERGLVEARGEKRGRTYHFSPALYKRFHMEAEYIRTRGFAPIQQEQMVLEYVKHKGRITRSDAAELCQISLHQASRLLRALKERHPAFRSHGTGRGTYYIWEA